jgi:hypothetical protein
MERLIQNNSAAKTRRPNISSSKKRKTTKRFCTLASV